MSNVINAALGFNYDLLPPETADVARQAAGRIRRRIGGGFLAIGHDLLEIKKLLGHGQFGAWLEAEFGLSHRSATRYMAAANFEAANLDTVAKMLPGIVERISAPSMPAFVRNACVERTARDETVTVGDVDALVSEYQEARIRVRMERPRRKPRTPDAVDEQARQEAEHLAREERDMLRRDQARRELVDLIIRCLGEDVVRAAELAAKVAGYTLSDPLIKAIVLAAGGVR